LLLVWKQTQYQLLFSFEVTIFVAVALGRLFKRTFTMAWFCSGTTNKELIDNLWSAGLIQNERVKRAMLGVSITRAYPVFTLS
jgi:hypothetical protein